MLDDAEDVSSSTNDAKFDKASSKSGSKGPSSKSKDLSHVPCKFFRVGSCTAGSSCPFSHSAAGPGQQKEACAWFVKGNCKFGHKCALAHVLPGQSTAMDRRNKKAAQLAATSSSGGGAPKDRERERDRDRDSRGRKSVSTTTSTTSQAGRGGTPSRSNTLLSGSTAPTRMLPTGARPPLPLSISKAAPAPAETAPSLQDADFTSYDSFVKSAEQAEHGVDAHEAFVQAREDEANNGKIDSPTNGISSPLAKSASPFPGSTPSKPHRFTGRHGSSPSVDFGPVGSPPRASPSANSSANANPIRINGFSPGTSPRDPAYATQPLAAGQTFSAPGTNLFMHPSSPRGSGLAASLSLGGTQPMPNTQSFAVGSLPILSRTLAESQAYSEALDDEDMEEFVPSSLKDLLTPEEQNRRMSRTSSSQTGAGVVGGIPTSLARSGLPRDESRHRHSHSVPSASLLSQDIRSIWADAGGELGQMDNNMGFGISPSTSGAGILGTSPSFASSSGLHPYDSEGPSPSMLNPSNASAAFLGLHHYMAHSRMPGGGIGATRAVSQGNIHHQAGLTSTGAALTPSTPSSFDALNSRAHGLSSSPSHLSRAPFDAFSSSPSKHGYSSHRPVPAAASAAFRAPDQAHALSPGSRALQAHAPGQSLPQGLAAGASRIHLQPPTAFSPGSHGNELGVGASVSPAGSGFDWMSATPTKQQHFEQPVAAAAATSPPASGVSGVGTPASEQPVHTPASKDADVGGLTSAFSHLSYSSVAASGLRGHHPHPHGSAAAAVPTSMSRRSSARGWSAHPLSSPLSGPVLTNDDDDLFSMDEEK